MAFGTLVDSNVLLDIMTEDPVWHGWATTAHADKAFLVYRRNQGTKTS